MNPFIVAVLGTGTEVGKTWVTCELIRQMGSSGFPTFARKPVQSFAEGTPDEELDSLQLASASGEAHSKVCRPERSYSAAMAPPFAARLTGRPTFTVSELLEEITWPSSDGIGFLETAGGCLSPIAEDGTSLDLALLAQPEVLLLVADAGLGTINSVLLSIRAIQDEVAKRRMPSTRLPLVFAYLNRYEEASPVHSTNFTFLGEKLGECGIRIFKDSVALSDSIKQAAGNSR